MISLLEDQVPMKYKEMTFAADSEVSSLFLSLKEKGKSNTGCCKTLMDKLLQERAAVKMEHQGKCCHTLGSEHLVPTDVEEEGGSSVSYFLLPKLHEIQDKDLIFSPSLRNCLHTFGHIYLL